MAWGVKKTEHAETKKGTGAFYGHKADAKYDSSRKRCQNGTIPIHTEILETEIQNIPVYLPDQNFARNRRLGLRSHFTCPAG